MRGRLAVGFSVLLLVGAALAVSQARRSSAQEPRPDPEYLAPPGWSAPYTPAVRFGDFLYLSGQIGNRPGTSEVVAGGIKAETRQALENVRALVQEHGSSMDRVLKCLVMMADIAEWDEMNEVYVTFFPEHRPARSTFAANGLVGNTQVEIECIAAVD